MSVHFHFGRVCLTHWLNKDLKTCGEFLAKKVMSLEVVWFEVTVTLQLTSNQTPSKIQFLTQNSPSGVESLRAQSLQII